MLKKTATLLVAIVALIYTLAIWNVRPPRKLPEICYGKMLERPLMDRLAKIALLEAAQKKISVETYAGFIAIESESKEIPLRPIYALRFSVFACEELGLDGGGFDVEVDRKTLEVLTSYISTL